MSMLQRMRGAIISDCYTAWSVGGSRVLDIGCGNAEISHLLHRSLNLTLWGTDIIDYRKFDIPFKRMAEGKTLPFDDASFDYAMFNDVLHHSSHIEELLREGRRVANTLLVFEDRSSLLMHLFDVGLNYLYCPRMPCPRNFKTEEGWMNVFTGLGFRCERGMIRYPFWYPLRHMVFRLGGAQ
jgi:SAM-dependent methyltransferase